MNMKKKSFLDYLFTDTGEVEPQAPAQSATITNQPVQASVSEVIPQPQLVTAPTITLNPGVLDEKFITFFNKVLDDANFEGQDYYEFKEKFKQMTEVAPAVPENTRIQMAYAAMLSDGVTKTKLTETAQKYIDILESKHGEILTEFASKRDKEINGRDGEIQKLQDEFENITKRMQEIQTSIITLKTEKSQEESKLELNHRNFEASYLSVVTTIKEDINKININIL